MAICPVCAAWEGNGKKQKMSANLDSLQNGIGNPPRNKPGGGGHSTPPASSPTPTSVARRPTSQCGRPPAGRLSPRPIPPAPVQPTPTQPMGCASVSPVQSYAAGSCNFSPTPRGSLFRKTNQSPTRGLASDKTIVCAGYVGCGMARMTTQVIGGHCVRKTPGPLQMQTKFIHLLK